MNRKAVVTVFIVGLVCFALGLVGGSILFHRSAENSVTTQFAGASKSGAESLSRALDSSASPRGALETATSSAAGAAATNAISGKQSDIAELKAALNFARGRWDLGKLYQVMDSLSTNEFPEAIAACLKSDYPGNY